MTRTQVDSTIAAHAHRLSPRPRTASRILPDRAGKDPSGPPQPSSTALARTEAGRRVDKLYEQMVELQEQIDASPTETLQDACVKLRRLSAYVEDVRPARLLSGALEAVEKAAEVA